MPRVLLATFNLMPDGEEGGVLLVQALAERGVDASFAVWDDPAVDWAAADLVVVRSTWDYHRRLAEFLAWAREVESSTPILNGAEVFAWNADKAYLDDLSVPTVPTRLLDDSTLVPGLRAAVEDWGSVVIKPRTGAGGVGLVVAESLLDPRLEGLTAAPWIVQPVVDSVRTVGESSLFVFAGRAVSQVDKVATDADVRVHEVYGGSSRAVKLDPARAAAAEAAVVKATDVAAARGGRSLDYARVDLMSWQGEWVVGELELIEPGLYLDVDPGNADRFAGLVSRTT